MRNFFSVKSPIQRKYLRLIAVSLMLPTFVIGGCLYYLIFALLAQHIAIPEFIAYMLFPVVEKINTILVFALPALFVLLLGTGMLISHRLAGPVERLKKEMELIAGGNYSKRIKMRKDDDLRPIADGINQLLDKIGG